MITGYESYRKTSRTWFRELYWISITRIHCDINSTTCSCMYDICMAVSCCIILYVPIFDLHENHVLVTAASLLVLDIVYLVVGPFQELLSHRACVCLFGVSEMLFFCSGHLC